MTDKVSVQLVPLEDAPWALTTVAGWIFDQWYSVYKTKTVQDVETLLRHSCQAQDIPSTLVALSGPGQPEEALGTASLLTADMDSHPELTPWLADVFVAPAARGRGIAKQLVRGIENLARQQGLTRLYLFTPDQQELYAKLGWQLRAKELYRGTENYLMFQDL